MARLIPLSAPAACNRLEVSDSDLASIERDALVRMLWLVYLVRDFETAVLDLKDADLVHGPAHTSVGQEAVAAAIAEVLRKDDMVGSTHRAHGHFVAKALAYYAPEGFQPLRDALTPAMQIAVDRTLAEIMGLRDGWCGGRGGSMHLYDGKSGNLGSNAIVGGGIPLATGAAWAQRFLGKDSLVVSVFGDGAINQGCFHEVANMAALWDIPIIYLVENNLYAVGTSTDISSCLGDLAQRSLSYGIDSVIVDGMNPVALYLALKEATEHIRQEPHPYFIEAKTYRFYHHAGRIAGSAFGYRDKQEEDAWLTRDPVHVLPQKMMAAGLLTDEENQALIKCAQEAVTHALDYCTIMEGSKRIIPEAKWPAADSVLDNVRSQMPAPVNTPVASSEEQKEITYVQAISSVTLRAMERDPRVVVLGEEVANLRGGAYGATKGIKEVFPDRLINTPISETGFVGIGGGAAAVGLHPVVEIMFPDFALMASDQLFNQIGKLRHMYGGQISFPYILRTRVAIGYGYGGQHSMDPAGFFAQFPGWRVVAPSTPYDYIGLFNTAMTCQDPVLIMEHGLLYAEKGMVPADSLDFQVPYGSANVVREGTDLTVLTYLYEVRPCLAAAEELAQSGLSVEVIDLRTVDYIGMDYETIGNSLHKTGSLLIIEQAPYSLGIGGRLADEVQRRFFDFLDCPVGRLSGLDLPNPVSRRLEQVVVPSISQIKTSMQQGAQHRF
ncbi:MAG: thiamine pyrophosphate-dependent enzyme [Chloroflexi bacterium]|nr:thiamine pyrophosphate-dependent enzyme [Chloroflexota bacterium]